MGGRIYSISTSPKRGTLKQEVETARIKKLGLEDDGHSGDWERQVTLMDYKDFILVQKEYGLSLAPGDMAENIIVQNIDFSKIREGTKIRLGAVACLEVSQIGKEDHPSVVTKAFGVSILPQKGLFCRVLKEGFIQRGDRVEIVEG